VFEDFAHVWTPTLPSRELRERPVPFTLAGERLVLFRDGGGRAAALVDRCPHRGVALSLGKRTAAGCLECPFHGWQFDGHGANVHVPFNPEARRERLAATPVPVREVGGLVWVYTAPGDSAPTEPGVPEALAAADVRTTFLHADWDAHWTRAMENMLDYPHLPFVHRTTIGRDLRRRMTPDTRVEMTWEDRPHGGLIRVAIDADPPRDILEFHAPNAMALLLAPRPKLFRIHAFCIPTTPGRTRMLVATTRAFAAARLLDPLFDLGNRKILDQDRAVVESSQPPEVPPPGAERSVETDRPTLRFRSYYLRQLKGSAAHAATSAAASGPDVTSG
jgi:phenylpropionate dioxygenase-like ring-hydroxylating dioxygenase large terminal subunit